MAHRLEEVWRYQRLVESNFNSDRLHRVEELLLQWGRQQSGDRVAEGYARSDSSCQGAISSVQWDETTEVVESRTHAYLVRAVESAVSELPLMQEAVLRAIYANNVGSAVFRHGRLKGRAPDDIKALHLEAIRAVYPLLRRRGVGLD